MPNKMAHPSERIKAHNDFWSQPCLWRPYIKHCFYHSELRQVPRPDCVSVSLESWSLGYRSSSELGRPGAHPGALVPGRAAFLGAPPCKPGQSAAAGRAGWQRRARRAEREAEAPLPSRSRPCHAHPYSSCCCFCCCRRWPRASGS